MKKLILLILISFLGFCKETKNPNNSNDKIVTNKMVVIARSGLNMRAMPESTAKLIVTVPFNQEVNFIEEKNEIIEIGHAKGKWAKISYNNFTGWVFGAYLSKYSQIKVKSENELHGISIIWLSQTTGVGSGGVGNEEPEKFAHADWHSVILTFCPNQILVGTCNIGGYGAGEIRGKWYNFEKISTGFSLSVSGQIDSEIVQDKITNYKDHFDHQEIKIIDNISSVNLPPCTDYSNHKVIITRKIVEGSKCP